MEDKLLHAPPRLMGLTVNIHPHRGCGLSIFSVVQHVPEICSKIDYCGYCEEFMTTIEKYYLSNCIIWFASNIFLPSDNEQNPDLVICMTTSVPV